MKRKLLLALGTSFVQAAMCLAQGTTVPGPKTTPEPVVVEQPSFVPMYAMTGAAPREYRIWSSTEFLTWWTKDIHVTTPLVTTATNLTDPTSGQLGSANTTVALGNESIDFNQRYGARFTLGGWLDSDSSVGVEVNYFFITPRSTTKTVGSDGTTIIGLPFFNVTTGNEAFLPISAPPIPILGGIPARSAAAALRVGNNLQGAEMNLVGRLRRDDTTTIDGLLGFRYIHFSEDLDFATATNLPGTKGFIIPGRIPIIVPGFPAVTTATMDSFYARNNFYGGQLGLRGRRDFGSFYVQGTGKVALGCMNETMNISGATTIATSTGVPTFLNFTTSKGGFYALPSNIGSHSRHTFCVAPEIELRLGYNVTRNINVFVAYDFLYLSSVARPGNSIDHNINPTQAPLLAGFPNTPTGTPSPLFNFPHSDFWAQGVNFGVEFKF